jgi:hypothetical protein
MDVKEHDERETIVQETKRKIQAQTEGKHPE